VVRDTRWHEGAGARQDDVGRAGHMAAHGKRLHRNQGRSTWSGRGLRVSRRRAKFLLPVECGFQGRTERNRAVSAFKDREETDDANGLPRRVNAVGVLANVW
jgi:hypothetical protein